MEEGKYSLECVEARRCGGGCAQPPRLRAAPLVSTARPTPIRLSALGRHQGKEKKERTETHQFRFARMRVPLACSVDRNEIDPCRVLKTGKPPASCLVVLKQKATAKPPRSSALECDQNAAPGVRTTLERRHERVKFDLNS